MPKNRDRQRENKRRYATGRKPPNLGIKSPSSHFKTSASEIETVWPSALETKRRKH